MRKSTAAQLKEAETNAYLAKGLRYLKPLCVELNLDTIKEKLYEMSAECSDVTYTIATSSDEILGGMLGDDEDEAYEFRTSFSDLEAECEQLRNDLDEEYVDECFDEFMVATHAGRRTGGYMGYDEYVGDYFGIDYFESGLSEDQEESKVLRMTKREMLETAQRCFGIALAYMGLRDRYSHLKAAIDILRGGNRTMMDAVRRIEGLYEQVSGKQYQSEVSEEALREWEGCLALLPEEAWIQ